MKNELHTGLLLLEQKFDCLKSDLVTNSGYEIINEYFGPITDDAIFDFATLVEQNLYSSKKTKTTVKRVFLVLIESLQNIAKHCLIFEGGKKIGACCVAENDECIEIYALNSVTLEDKEKLIQLFDEINALSLDELKDKYMQVLDNGEMSEKHGASLGLMTIRLKTSRPLIYNFIDVDEKTSCFLMRVGLDKSQVS